MLRLINRATSSEVDGSRWKKFEELGRHTEILGDNNKLAATVAGRETMKFKPRTRTMHIWPCRQGLAHHVGILRCSKREDSLLDDCVVSGHWHGVVRKFVVDGY